MKQIVHAVGEETGESTAAATPQIVVPSIEALAQMVHALGPNATRKPGPKAKAALGHSQAQSASGPRLGPAALGLGPGQALEGAILPSRLVPKPGCWEIGFLQISFKICILFHK